MGNQSERSAAVKHLRLMVSEETMDVLKQVAKEKGVYRRGVKPLVEGMLKRFAEKRRADNPV